MSLSVGPFCGAATRSNCHPDCGVARPADLKALLPPAGVPGRTTERYHRAMPCRSPGLTPNGLSGAFSTAVATRDSHPLLSTGTSHRAVFLPQEERE
ncbi:hypothetical protein CesoFtcFv8_010670 [Champsocephalus esox]|uniref:Uncharacterized protein n=1 Tax=Champsocephalus esox TaxID=159716 RepID=A0AAN8H0D9_9TELE|nr:hypothetical protein CesoFtcFv8_010670 [Champsocephalus esox]